MTDVLLQEISNTDIDWMLATGTKTEIPTDTVLFERGQFVKSLYTWESLPPVYHQYTIF